MALNSSNEHPEHKPHPANSIQLAGDELARFWAFVDRRGPKECWPWKGKSRRGSLNYAVFCLSVDNPTGARHQYVHRIALIVAGVYVPDGAVVLHECDNPLCSNPAHFKPGTQSENMRDCYNKGRIRGCVKPPEERVKE